MHQAQEIVNSKPQLYRYAFQGQERDDEVKGAGNSYNYKYRRHDSRLGRFFAVDPLFKEYAYNSPYAFSENVVINAVELEGLERKVVINLKTIEYEDNGTTIVNIEESKLIVITASYGQWLGANQVLSSLGIKLKGNDHYGVQTINMTGGMVTSNKYKYDPDTDIGKWLNDYPAYDGDKKEFRGIMVWGSGTKDNGRKGPAFGSVDMDEVKDLFDDIKIGPKKTGKRSPKGKFKSSSTKAGGKLAAESIKEGGKNATPASGKFYTIENDSTDKKMPDGTIRRQSGQSHLLGESPNSENSREVKSSTK